MATITPDREPVWRLCGRQRGGSWQCVRDGLPGRAAAEEELRSVHRTSPSYWARVLQDWESWQSGVVVMAPDDFREFHPDVTIDLPAGYVALLYQSAAGTACVRAIRATDDAAAVTEGTLDCLALGLLAEDRN